MSNRPADILDQADALTQTLRDAGIANVRNALRPQQTQNPDGTWPITECDDCGVDIPAERLAMARIRCTCCEDVREKKAANFVKY